MFTFLVIDNCPHLSSGIHDILEMEFEGCWVLTAADGRTGLELACNYQPDLIFCKYMLPVMNGRELLRNLQQNHWTRQIPFLLNTVSSIHSVRWLDVEFGLDISRHLLNCPIDVEEMLDMIHHLLYEYRPVAPYQPKRYTIEEGGQRLFTSK